MVVVAVVEPETAHEVGSLQPSSDGHGAGDAGVGHRDRGFGAGARHGGSGGGGLGEGVNCHGTLRIKHSSPLNRHYTIIKPPLNHH